jgi:hypothetical protein
MAAILPFTTLPLSESTTFEALVARVAALEAGTGVVAPEYTNVSIVTLTTNQATGIDPIIAQDTGRRGLKIQPPADCLLLLSPSSTTGIQLVGGYPNGFDGGNALYVSGLATGNTLVIWTAD